MSQGNNEATGIIFAISIVCVLGYMLVLAFAAFTLFVAFVLTIIALLAWNTPRRIGKWIITPDEARSFVYRGLAGAGLVPAFWIFCCVIFDLPFHGDLLLPVALFGYVLGSVGITLLEDEEPLETQVVPMQTAVPEQLPTPNALPAPPKPPFRYATWDDEEARGK